MSAPRSSAAPCSRPSRWLIEFAERTHKLREALKAAASLPQDQRGVKIAELRASLRDLMASVKGGHGVRPDGTILHPASQETVWFDTAGTHTTCMHLEAEVKHTLIRRAAGRDGARMASSRLLEEHQIKLIAMPSSQRSLRSNFSTDGAPWLPWYCLWC
jgi:hypothetical protein